jgi:hypothetical protein
LNVICTEACCIGIHHKISSLTGLVCGNLGNEVCRRLAIENGNERLPFDCPMAKKAQISLLFSGDAIRKGDARQYNQPASCCCDCRVSHLGQISAA